MEVQIDWQRFHRLDDVHTTYFLSTAAGVFLTKGLINHGDITSLRAQLAQFTGKCSLDHSNSLIHDLYQSQEPFLQLLHNHFGTLGFSINLTRYSMRPVIDKLEKLISSFGLDLLKKSQLYFNHQAWLYEGTKPQRQTYVSSLLVELAEHCTSSLEHLQSLRQLCCDHMLASELMATADPSRGFDHELAASLGFDHAKLEVLPLCTEAKAKRRLIAIITTLTDTLGIAQNVLLQNHYMSSQQTLFQLDWLQAEAQRIMNLAFPESADLLLWELRRYNYLSALEMTLSCLEQTMDQFISSMPTSIPVAADSMVFSTSMHRKLTLDLIQSGVPTQSAQQSVAKLADYCQKNSVQPEALLKEELPHIDPLLTKSYLQNLAHSTQDQKANQALEKATTEKRLSTLWSKLQATLAPHMIVILAIFSSFIISCGVKKPPFSTVEEFRPEVPYRLSLKKPKQPLIPKGKSPIDEKIDGIDPIHQQQKKTTQKPEAQDDI